MKSIKYRNNSLPVLLLAATVTLAPAHTAKAICDVSLFDRTINDTVINGDVFISPDETVLITNTEITGSVKMETEPGVITHVTVGDNTKIQGNINATPTSDNGDGSVCIRGQLEPVTVLGSVAVEKGTGISGIEVRDKVDIFGAVSMDKSDSSECAGNFTIMGKGASALPPAIPLLRADVSAAGSCEVKIQDAEFNGDFQADDTTGDVTVKDITSSGDVQVQSSTGNVFFENIDSTSDISVDGASAVEWKNDSNTGGDAGFSNIDSVYIDSVANVNGLLSIGPANTVTVTNSNIKGGIEADVPRNITITDNEFPEGGVLISGSLNSNVYLAEGAVIERNTLGGGSLTVTQVKYVTIKDSVVENGNLTIQESESCDMSGNTVPKGNVEAAGCNGAGSGGANDTFECTATLDNANFPANGELRDQRYYWCDEDKVFGRKGEIQAGSTPDRGFGKRKGAKRRAKANLSNGKSYSTAIWDASSGTWKMESDDVTP